MNVLFPCTANSCRSLPGVTTFNHLAPESWIAMSAGSDQEIHDAFHTAYRIRRACIEAFFALPLDERCPEGTRLRFEVDPLGTRHPDGGCHVRAV
jgi:protein-tyrosine-phosphatase